MFYHLMDNFEKQNQHYMKYPDVDTRHFGRFRALKNGNVELIRRYSCLNKSYKKKIMSFIVQNVI